MAFQISYTLMTLLCENKDKTNTNKNAYLFHDDKNLFHDLLMQPCIRGISDILFLNRRINEGRIMMTVLIIPVIHTDALLKDKPNSSPPIRLRK